MKLCYQKFFFLTVFIFCVLGIFFSCTKIPELTLEEIEELIKKFDEECQNELITTDKENIPVSIAKGFARYDSGKDTNFMDVFNRADDAMYENKRKIKGLK